MKTRTVDIQIESAAIACNTIFVKNILLRQKIGRSRNWRTEAAPSPTPAAVKSPQTTVNCVISDISNH